MAVLRTVALLLVGLTAYYLYTPDTFSEEMVRGKRVLVTGASMGIGEQIAYEFARMGAHLMVTARSEKRLQEVVQKCVELGAGSAQYVLADMSNLTLAQQVVEETQRKLGGLDYLVLNHVGGTSGFGPFEGDMESLTSCMTINFLSYVQLTVAAMDMLQESQGGIIVLSSIAGRLSSPFTVAYSSAKFALEGFYGSLRHELQIRNIRLDITVAVLGLIDTDTATKQVDGKLAMQASPKEDCAREVVRAGVLRHREVFFPYWITKPAVLLRDWAPELLEAMAAKKYRLENIL
ncbi:hydroxysteroid 11-beta-dehydrogenase 1-like protein A [Tiliqua scincoides]|uniref:hydroxysteroid 11-beta-dehydrogenase 1-like protein A n=1 Tax=Tiliqua scincoides TaxID=71010 RepID=UPI003462F568